MDFEIRLATLDDIPTLKKLIADSAHGLGKMDYTEAQIEAALGGAWGVDTQLIRDGTYFVVQANETIIACGDGAVAKRSSAAIKERIGRQKSWIHPKMRHASGRFFVHPDWARRGIGTALLARCEAEAMAEGFRAVELMATLPGQRLYQKSGYVASAQIDYPVGPDLSIAFVPMRKDLIF